MERPYPDGVDCVWLAADRDGHLGAFVTGGVGPIPVQALNSEYASINETEERICELPRVSSAQLLVVVKRPDDFIALAERGVFVYDWSDVHRPACESIHAYEPVAAPTKPITVDALPDEIAALVEGIRLERIAFADGQALDIRAHMNCREGE